MPKAKDSQVVTFGAHALRESKDGDVSVGYIPQIVAPQGLALPHRQLDFTPVLLPEKKLLELLAQQRQRGRSLVFIGQVIVLPDIEEHEMPGCPEDGD